MDSQGVVTMALDCLRWLVVSGNSLLSVFLWLGAWRLKVGPFDIYISYYFDSCVREEYCL